MERYDRWRGYGEEVVVNQEAIARAAEAAGISIEEMGERIATAVEATRTLNQAQDDTPPRMEVNRDHLARLTHELGNAAVAYDILTNAQKRELTILNSLAETQDSFDEGLKRLGTRLSEDINAEIEENVKWLEEMSRRMSLGEADAQDYARAQLDVAKANKRLREELTGVKEAAEVLAPSISQVGVAADGTTVSVNELSDGTRRLTGESDRTTAATNRAAASFRAAAQSAIVYRSATGAAGGAGYVTQQTLRRQGEVNAAIAAGNQPIMGGTRIRLPGGGSRLVGTRRF
jgi:transcription elongation GreA/GreB family factor